MSDDETAALDDALEALLVFAAEMQPEQEAAMPNAPPASMPGGSAAPAAHGEPLAAAPTAADVISTYRFPVVADTGDKGLLDDAELVECLQQIRLLGRSKYAEHRVVVCAVNLELNRRGRLAPRFRPRLHPRKRVLGLPYVDSDISNDQQVIDMHWLHCRKARLSIANLRWAALGRRDASFNFELASDLAAEGGAMTRKAESILRIRPTDQYQLAMLQSKSIAGTWRVIERGRDDAGGEQLGMEDVRLLLDEQAKENPIRLAAIDDQVLLWACWRLCGDKGRSLARLFALATGKPERDASNVNQRLARVLKRLP